MDAFPPQNGHAWSAEAQVGQSPSSLSASSTPQFTQAAIDTSPSGAGPSQAVRAQEPEPFVHGRLILK